MRRNWALRGCTPVLRQRGNSRQKASVIAALAVSPRRRKIRLLFSLRPHENVHAEWILAFLRDLARHLGPRMVLIWDNLNVHRARAVQRVVTRRRHLTVEYLLQDAQQLLRSFLRAAPLSLRLR